MPHKHGDPDKGPPMIEGEHHYDKGYQTDNENLPEGYPDNHQRGNRYTMLKNEISSRDSKKLEASKRKKIS